MVEDLRVLDLAGFFCALVSRPHASTTNRTDLADCSDEATDPDLDREFLNGAFPMLEQELLRFVKSFLGRRESVPTYEERSAWEEFFVTYDGIVRATIRRSHKAVHVVDDVAQDAWIVLIHKLPKWRFDPVIGSIGAWVSRIAQRLAAKRARRNAKRRAGSLSETRTDTLVDPEPGPDAKFERMQEHELFGTLVLEVAASMAHRDGRMVVLRFVECWDVPRIAHHFNVSDDCVWSVLHRSIPKLRDFLRRKELGPL